MSEKIIEVDGKRYMKVQKGKYFDKKKYKNKKMKRHHPIRNTIIIATTVLIVAPAAFIFGAFYVPKKTNLPDTYSKFEENLSNSISKSLTNLGSTGQLRITVDENFLNSGLSYLKENFIAQTSINKYVDNIYCTVNEKVYDFSIDAHAYFFQTRMKLSTTLDIDENNFTFKINEVYAGRLPLGGLASKMLPQFISEDSINSALKSAHFDATLSIPNMTITYPRSNFKTNLSEILDAFNLTKTDVENPLGGLASMILSLYDEIKAEPSFNNGISFGLNFEKLQERVKDYAKAPINPNEKHDRTEPEEKKYASIKQFVVKCLNKGLVSPKTALDKETQGCDNLFKFLLDGYSNKYELSNDLKKAIVKEYVDQTSENPDPSKITKYVGLYKENKDKDEEIIYKNYFCDDLVGQLNNPNEKYKDNSHIMTNEIELQSAISKLTNTTDSVTFGQLGEDLLSDYLRYAILPNFAFCFPIKVNNEYMMPTITFSDFNCNIDNVKLEKEGTTYPIQLIGDLDIEGLLVPFTVLCEVNTSNRTISIRPSKYYLGKFELSSVGEALMSFITQSFSTNPDDLFSFNSTDKSFAINFSKFKVSGTGEYAKQINGVIDGTSELGKQIKLIREINPKSEDHKGQLIFKLQKSA